MNRALALLIIGLALGGGIGFVLGSGQAATPMDHSEMDHSMHGGDGGGGHDHDDLLEVTGPAPRIMAHVMRDPVAGWNLHLMVENFTFNPMAAGMKHVAGEGHAHVYANDVKIARLYGEWLHLDDLPSDEVELHVTLNSNDHRTLAVDGEPVEAVVTLVNR